MINKYENWFKSSPSDENKEASDTISQIMDEKKKAAADTPTQQSKASDKPHGHAGSLTNNKIKYVDLSKWANSDLEDTFDNGRMSSEPDLKNSGLFNSFFPKKYAEGKKTDASTDNDMSRSAGDGGASGGEATGKFEPESIEHTNGRTNTHRLSFAGERKNARGGSIPFDFSEKDYNKAEMNAEKVERDIKQKKRLFYLRTSICFFISMAEVYLSLAPTFIFPLPFNLSYINTPFIYVFIMLFLQIICMLTAVELVASGIFRLLCLRPTVDSLVFFTCAASLFHGICILLYPSWGGYMPYCAVSCLLVYFSVQSRKHKYTAFHKTVKIIGSSSFFTGITFEQNNSGDKYATKYEIDKKNIFFDSFNYRTMSDKVSYILSPAVIILSLICSFAASFLVGRPECFPFILSAITAGATPCCFIISSSLPLKRTAAKLYSVGAALLGLNGLKKAVKCKKAALFDEDLYPVGTVELNGIKIAGASNYMHTVSCISSVIEASDMGTKRVFADISRQHTLKRSDVKELRFYESGGMTAQIDGRSIAVGTAGFLMRLGIRITEGAGLKNVVFAASNMNFSGLFALKYTQKPIVISSLNALIKNKFFPILATRDFNLTPNNVEKAFKLKRGVLIYPDVADRLDMSDRTRFFDADPDAISTSGGIFQFAASLIGMKTLALICRKNAVLSIISALIGLAVTSFLAYGAEFAVLSPANLLLYQFLWLLIVFIQSLKIYRH